MTATVRARATRARRLIARLHVDGRLPPTVAALYRDVARRRVRAATDRLVARSLPVRGRAAGEPTVRVGARRWETAGPIDTSASELALRHADQVIDALTTAGLHPFVVAHASGTTIGLELAERDAAWNALASLWARPGWYVRLGRGRRARVLAGARRGRRRARRASQWEVWSVRSLGPEAALGFDEAAVVGFWAEGDPGRLERIGVRGQERFARTSAWTVEELSGHRFPGRDALPVGAELGTLAGPVDLVYTWVDGDDPAWRRSFAEWSNGPAGPTAATDPWRYRSRDELRYSLRSAWLFAGWARRIHLVTDGQVPAWLIDDPRVSVVAHRDIFPADWLPTFNSHAIESRLHHIPGLAEHFVYLNDDVFLGRPLLATAFFTANGLPLVFPSDARVVTGSDVASGGSDLAVDTAAARGRALIAERFGRTVGYKLHHAPFALRRSLLADLEREYPFEFERTGRSRFRHPDDLSIAASFANHYAVAAGRAVLDRFDVDYVHLESGRLGLHLDRLLLGRAFSAFCLNETEEPAQDRVRIDESVGAFLDGYFPVPAPWEARGTER